MMEPLSFHVEATVLTDNRLHGACSEDCQLKACQKNQMKNWSIPSRRILQMCLRSHSNTCSGGSNNSNCQHFSPCNNKETRQQILSNCQTLQQDAQCRHMTFILKEKTNIKDFFTIDIIKRRHTQNFQDKELTFQLHK